MYPDCDSKPIDIAPFKNLEGVIDAVYNPLCTNLVLDAMERGIKAEGGLYMLVMQAVVAVEKFLDTEISKDVVNRVYNSVFFAKENIVLTGMPGSGKTTVGKILSEELKIPFFDSDEIIKEKSQKTIDDLNHELLKKDLESRRKISCLLQMKTLQNSVICSYLAL